MSTDNKTEEKNNDTGKTGIPEEKTATTQHSLKLAEKELTYTVTTGTIILKEETEKEGEKPKASVFYVAYTLDEIEDHTSRPITFSFNGGPGSSSVWMHLGLLGPKRVDSDAGEGQPLPPPYQLVDNEFTLLDKTDLVFIDPVSTGYSRTVPGEAATEFHEVKKDIESVGAFIHQYATRNKRWESPKFLIGESYGTTRAAGLSNHLQERYGMYLNGIMLISSILNFGTAQFDPGNDLPYILFLPTYTATAWYHKNLNADLQKDLQATLREVESFARNEYVLALMKGNKLSPEERQQIVQKLARYTGLSEKYIEDTDLRIEIFRFTKELLRGEGLTVGRLDSRFTGKDRDNAGEVFERDPSMSAIMGPYSATLNHYIRHDLEFELEIPYEILAPLYQNWKYEGWKNQYLNVAEELRKAIASNPFLKVFVANGYYDFATPYFATEYTFSHIGLPPEQYTNISMGFYEAGHMMYIHLPSLKVLKEDLDQFIDNATTK
ncbi:peptidase S10 [bacterium]|nr:peptidase S10 [bacterium]